MCEIYNLMIIAVLCDFRVCLTLQRLKELPEHLEAHSRSV